ncbi:hypothetical protein BU17DRAFT_61934 [Hysterangium stoloniferum]|nr:hypothetical protein BU17DRAFT_61934 [Hysterangium stoloniferum]
MTVHMFNPNFNSPPTDLGLKVLAEGSATVLDIIAIHGLDGDREGTWTADNGILWIRDMLPDDISNARVLTYGLGGIILKYALILANKASDDHLPKHKSIATSTIGLIFLGTPHQGSDAADLALRLYHILSIIRGTNVMVLQHLTKNSEALQDLLADYNSISDLYSTLFCYESYDTPMPGGFSKMIVPKCSAVVPGAINAETIGLNKSHLGMCKFASKDDDDYMTVLRSILTFAKKAPHFGDGSTATNHSSGRTILDSEMTWPPHKV